MFPTDPVTLDLLADELDQAGSLGATLTMLSEQGVSAHPYDVIRALVDEIQQLRTGGVP